MIPITKGAGVQAVPSLESVSSWAPKPALTNKALSLSQPHPLGKRRQNRLPDGTPASRFPWQNGSDP